MLHDMSMVEVQNWNVATLSMVTNLEVVKLTFISRAWIENLHLIWRNQMEISQERKIVRDMVVRLRETTCEQVKGVVLDYSNNCIDNFEIGSQTMGTTTTHRVAKVLNSVTEIRRINVKLVVAWMHFMLGWIFVNYTVDLLGKHCQQILVVQQGHVAVGYVEIVVYNLVAVAVLKNLWVKHLVLRQENNSGSVLDKNGS